MPRPKPPEISRDRHGFIEQSDFRRRQQTAAETRSIHAFPCLKSGQHYTEPRDTRLNLIHCCTAATLCGRDTIYPSDDPDKRRRAKKVFGSHDIKPTALRIAARSLQFLILPRCGGWIALN
jgi:hypothetical protein